MAIDLMTIRSLCERLEIGRTKANELLSAGELDRVSVGRGVRVTADSVERYVERNLLRSHRSA